VSVLGYGWTSQGVWLSGRPDPARPPCRLDGASRSGCPQGTAVPAEVCASGYLAGHELLERWFVPAAVRGRAKPDWLTAALTRYFEGLFHWLCRDADLQVLLLGGIEQLVIVVPPHARPPDTEALRAILPASGLTVTVIAHHVAAIAGLLEGFVPQQPFLACDWDNDLVLRTVLTHDTLCHLGQVGGGQRLRGAGRASLERHLIRAALAKHPRPPLADQASGHPGDALADLAASVAAFVEDVLAGGDLRFSVVLEPAGVPSRPAAAVRRLPPARPVAEARSAGHEPESAVASHAAAGGAPWEITMSEDEVLESWTPVFERAANFLRATAREAGRAGLEMATLSGQFFQVPRLSGLVRAVLDEEGFSAPSGTPIDAAMRGLHTCVRGRALLPYDCGVLLKSRVSTVGVGTLVLVRPAAIGEERQSDVLCLPVPQDAAVEVAFYLRRLNADATKVIVEVMKSHSFAPALDGAREARLQVSMRVDLDAGGQATVSVDLHDLNGNQHIRFERLPLAGAVPLRSLPLRDARQLRAVEWLERIRRLRASLSPGSMPSTVKDWRRLFQSGPRVSRRTYAGEICSAAAGFFQAVAGACHCKADELAQGALTSLAVEAFWKAASPDQIQAEARRLLFAAMHVGAGVMAEAGCNHCATWRHLFPDTAQTPADDVCARKFLTAVSEDLAGQDAEAVVVGAVEGMLRMHHLACCSPSTLNVAWDGSLD